MRVWEKIDHELIIVGVVWWVNGGLLYNSIYFCRFQILRIQKWKKKSSSYHSFCWYHMKYMNTCQRGEEREISPTLCERHYHCFPYPSGWENRAKWSERDKPIQSHLGDVLQRKWMRLQFWRGCGGLVFYYVWGENTSLFWNMSPKLWIISFFFPCGSPSGFSGE